MTAGRDFEDWYAANAGHVVATLAAAVGDEDEARDAVADACAKAFARWSRVGRMDNVAGWVYVVALRDLRRARARRGRALPDPGPVVEAPPEIDPELWRAVQALPERMRLAIALRYVGDLDEASIAAVMSISRGGVASLLHKARASLRAALEMEVSTDDR